MSEIAPALRLRSLSPLPTEILQSIAQYCDLNTALALCRTCRSLQRLWTTREWDTLDFTSGLNDTVTNLDKEDTLAYVYRAATVQRHLKSVLWAIRANPDLLHHVRTIRIEPIDGSNRSTATALLRVLRAVAPHIERLDILSLPCGTDWWPDEALELGHQSFYFGLSVAAIDFPKLVHLKVVLGHWAMRPFDTWLTAERMPHLQALEVCSAEGAFDQPHHSLSPSDKPRFGLESLSFHLGGGKSPVGHDMLLALLCRIENLQNLKIQGDWRVARGAALVEPHIHIAGHTLSTVLVADGGVRHHPETRAAGRCLEWMTRLRMHTDLMVVEAPSWEETNELDLQNIKLLWNQGVVQDLIILTSPRPPLSVYISSSIGPTPSVTRHITHKTIERLWNIPARSVILLRFVDQPMASVYAASNTDPDLRVDPERWEAEGYCGLLIRSWTTWNVPPSERDHFWHIKALSRSMEYAPGRNYVGAQRCWRHFTHYRGKTVPMDVLRAVYDAAGISPEFGVDSLASCRGNDFPDDDAAWAVLREWRSTVEDQIEPEGVKEFVLARHRDAESDYSDSDSGEDD